MDMATLDNVFLALLESTIGVVPTRAKDVDVATVSEMACSKQLPALGSSFEDDDSSAKLAWSDEAPSVLKLALEGNTTLWYEGGGAAALRRRPELLSDRNLRAHFRTLRLKEMGIAALSVAAERFTRLEELNLSGNRLSTVEHLPPSLRILHAYDNQVASVSLEYGAARSLIHLGLGYNAVSDAVRLARALEGGAPALRCLDLSFNSITDLRDTALLVSLPSITSLWLAGNPVALLPAYRAFICREVVAVATARREAADAAEEATQKQRAVRQVVTGERKDEAMDALALLDGISTSQRLSSAGGAGGDVDVYATPEVTVHLNVSAVEGLADPNAAVDAADADAVSTPSAFVLDFTLDVHPGRLGVDSVRVPVVGGEAVLRLRPSVALRDALLLYGLRVRLLSAGAFTRVHTMRIVSPLPDHHHLSQPPPWLSLSRAASNLSSIPLIPLHYSLPCAEPAAVAAAAEAHAAAAEAEAEAEANANAEGKKGDEEPESTSPASPKVDDKGLPEHAFTIELGSATLDTKALLDPQPAGHAASCAAKLNVELNAAGWRQTMGKEPAAEGDDDDAEVMRMATFELTAMLNGEE